MASSNSAFSQSLSVAKLPEHEISYAMTIYKSPSLENRDEVIIHPHKGSPLLSGELLYTGFTRAKRTVTVVASEESLKTAVNSREIQFRGLPDLLAT